MEGGYKRSDPLIGISMQAPVITGSNTGSTRSLAQKVPYLICYWNSQLPKQQTTRGRIDQRNNHAEDNAEELKEGEVHSNEVLLDEYFLLALDSNENKFNQNKLEDSDDVDSVTGEASFNLGSNKFTSASANVLRDQHCLVVEGQNSIDHTGHIEIPSWKSSLHSWGKFRTSVANSVPDILLLLDTSHDLPDVLARVHRTNCEREIRPSRHQYLQFTNLKYLTVPLKRRRMDPHVSDDSIGSDEDAEILRSYQLRTGSQVAAHIQDSGCEEEDDDQQIPPRLATRRSSLNAAPPPKSLFDKNGETERASRTSKTSGGLDTRSRRHSLASTDVEHLAEMFASLKARRSILPDIGESVLVLEEDEPPITQNLLILPESADRDNSENGAPKGSGHVERKDSFKEWDSPRRRSKLRGRGHSGRRSSIDVATLQSLKHASNDPHFAREIFHQNIISMASRESINEECEDGENEEVENDISARRSRRLSISNLAGPLLSSGSISLRKTTRPKGPLCDDSAMSQQVSARAGKRRSSWACTSMNDRRGSRATLLNLSNFQNAIDTAKGPDMTDPYRVTLHFISDPKQSKKLRSLIRPLTRSVTSTLKLFNYVDRSEPMILEYKEPDIMEIPSLAVMLFLQEEKGIERVLEARQYLKEDPPWQMHHKDLVGGSGVVPYPTNNQDFYSHAEGMPLWAIRQILGKDRLRFMVFASHGNWGEMMSFYSNVLDRDVQCIKEDFCYFAAFACDKLSLEVQLALKRLPPDFVPTPLDAAILQFKIDDIERLTSLLPSECSAVSDVRWQTTDPDGNRVLLLTQPRSRSSSVGSRKNSLLTDENANHEEDISGMCDSDLPTDYV